MKIVNIILSFFLSQAYCLSQWSTSVIADSGLIVCPGLASNLLVSEADGSIIISGAGASFIHVQKLD